MPKDTIAKGRHTKEEVDDILPIVND